VSPLGPWTRDNVLEFHIFILLLIWFIADRCKFYFTDIPRYWYMIKLYYGAWRGSRPSKTNWAGPR
jgi:hypothetical protein